MLACCQHECPEIAALAVYWPSSKGPVPMCVKHAAWAAHVAQVMGFRLPIGPIDLLLEPLAQEVENAMVCHGRIGREDDRFHTYCGSDSWGTDEPEPVPTAHAPEQITCVPCLEAFNGSCDEAGVDP